MVNVKNISLSVYLLTEKNQTLKFDTRSLQQPSVAQCNYRIIGLNLSCSDYFKKISNIEKMRISFGNTKRKKIIQKLPEGFEVVEELGYKAIRTSNTLDISPLIMAATTTGLVGYWNESDFIVVASPKYSFIIDSLEKMIIPNRCKLSTTTISEYWGVDLLMMARK